MALSVGSLFVSLRADTSGLVRGLQEGLKSVEKFSKEVKKAASDVAQVSGLLTAFAGAMLKAGAGIDSGIAASLERLKNSFTAMAQQIGQLLLPAVNQLTSMVRTLADYINGLTPAQKAAISNFAMMAAEVGAVALVLGRVAQLGGTVAGVLGGLTKAIGAIGLGNLVALVAVIGAIIVGVTLLHKAWRQNWGGIRDVIDSVINGIASGLGEFGEFVSKVFDFLVDSVEAWVQSLLNAVDAVQKLTGSNFVDVEGLRGAFKGLAGDLKSGEFFKSGIAFGKKMGETIVDTIVEEWGPAVDALMSKFNGAFKRGQAGSGVGGGGGKIVSGAVGGDVGISASIKNLKELAGAGPDVKGQRLGQVSTAGGSGGLDLEKAREVSQEYWEGMEDVGTDTVGQFRMRMHEFAQGLKQAAKASIGQISGALQFGANMLLSKMGELGQVIQSGIQGFQSGGIWGALFAVILELLSRFERFQEIIDIGNGQLLKAMEDFKSGFGALIDGFKRIMGGIGIIAEGVHAVLNPILMLIGDIFSNIAPIFVSIGQFLKGIGEVLKPLFELHKRLSLFGYIIKIIAWVIGKILGLVLASVAGMGDVWNWIIDAIWNLLVSLNLNDAAKEVAKVKWDNSGLKQQSIDMLTAGLDFSDSMIDAKVSADEAAGANQRLAESAKAASEALLNVPSGYRVQAARYGATAQAQYGVTAQAITGTSAYTLLQKMQELNNTRTTGNPTDGGG